MSGLEVALFFAVKALATKYIAAHGTSSLLTMGGHLAANHVGTELAAHGAAHVSQQLLAHGTMTCVNGVAAGAMSATTALGTAGAVASGVWGYQKFIRRVAEIRKDEGFDKDSFFDKKGPFFDLVGKGGPMWALLDELLAAVFALADMMVAGLERKHKEGVLKTKVEDTEVCDTCGCPDLSPELDSSLGTDCCEFCGCPASSHRTISFEKHFLEENGPGAKILEILAESIYPHLERKHPSDPFSPFAFGRWANRASHNQSASRFGQLGRLSGLKKKLFDTKGCAECGCTDYNEQEFFRLCRCDHDGDKHDIWYNAANCGRTLATHLHIIADALYMDLKRENVLEREGTIKRYYKTSVFEIASCPAGDCPDFDFQRMPTFSNSDHNAYCTCGYKRHNHSKVVNYLARSS